MVHSYDHRKNAVKIMTKLMKNRKNSYTVASLGCSPDHPKSVRTNWRKALRTALYQAKRRFGLEYILVFETSEKGYEHAHLMLMQRHGVYFTRLDQSTIRLIREMYFRRLFQLVNDLRMRAHKEKPLEFFLSGLNVDKEMLRIVKAKKGNKKYLAPGTGDGFPEYLLKKSELTQKGTAIVSKGLLTLKMGYINRLQSNGWKKHA